MDFSMNVPDLLLKPFVDFISAGGSFMHFSGEQNDIHRSLLLLEHGKKGGVFFLPENFSSCFFKAVSYTVEPQPRCAGCFYKDSHFSGQTISWGGLSSLV